MKVLFIACSYYDRNYRCLRRNKTGQSVIAGEICRNFSEGTDLDILVTGSPQRGRNLECGRMISTSLWELIKRFRFEDLKVDLLGAKPKEALKAIYTSMLVRRVRDLLDITAYDIVSIHDFSVMNMEVLKLCIEKEIKCVVTLHLYVGNDTKVAQQSLIQRRAREIFLLEETNVPITVVSAGMKRRILRDHPSVPSERVTVILNGIDMSKASDASCEPPKYNGKKLFLCIGTVGKRKNQLQLLHSLDYLDESVRKQIQVLFIGNDTLNGQLQREIQSGQYMDVAGYLGGIPHEELEKYYKKAYAVISTSLNEAFGLTFIEGFVFGIPAVFFDDIDAVDELYAPDAVELIRGKECRDVALAITAMVNKTWDKEKIREHAVEFDIREKAAEYEKVYKKTIHMH